MFNINGWELIVIAVLVLMVFGPERLPEFLFRAGQLLRQFRQMTDEATSEITREFRAAADLAEAELRRPLEETLAAAKEPFTDLTKPQGRPTANTNESAVAGAAHAGAPAPDTIADTVANPVADPVADPVANIDAAEAGGNFPNDLPSIAPTALFPPLKDEPVDMPMATSDDDLADSDDDSPGATDAA